MNKQTNNNIKSDDIDFDALNNPNLEANKSEGEATTEEKVDEKKTDTSAVKADTKEVKNESKTKTESKTDSGSKSETEAKSESTSDKTQEASTESESIIDTIFEGLKSSLGVEFTEEDLEGIELTEDLNTVNKLAELSANKLANKRVAEMINSHPDIQRAINYIQANGSLQGIEEQTSYPDYTQADLTQERVQELVYRDYLAAKGIGGEELEDMITLAKDKGQLESKAKFSQQALVDYYSQLDQENIQKNAKIVAEREAQQQQLYKEVTKTINGGKILGLNLSNEEKKAFTDFLYKPVDEYGRTARDLYDEQEYTIEQELYNEFLKFKKYASVSPKVDKKVKTLKDLKEANKGREVKIGGNSEMTTGNFNTGNEIDFEALKNYQPGRRPS